jgi:4-hydroxy-tetrahydrodipicolinate reductase
MRPLRIAVHGISGKMGQEILSVIKEERRDYYYLCASFDQNITSKSFESYTLLQNWAKQKPQVVIDFSAPKGLLEIASWCVKHKCPLVTGTTGLNENQLKSIKAVAKKFRCFSAPT